LGRAIDARERAYGASGLGSLTPGRQDDGLAGRLRVEEPVGFLGLLGQKEFKSGAAVELPNWRRRSGAAA